MCLESGVVVDKVLPKYNLFENEKVTGFYYMKPNEVLLAEMKKFEATMERENLKCTLSILCKSFPQNIESSFIVHCREIVAVI
jgi:hypothetical protein